MTRVVGKSKLEVPTPRPMFPQADLRQHVVTVYFNHGDSLDSRRRRLQSRASDDAVGLRLHGNRSEAQQIF